MLKVGKNHDQLKVVSDQIGTPTYTFDLAKLLVSMIVTDKYGYYHATNEGGYISWWDFTKEIFKQATEMGYDRYSEKTLLLHLSQLLNTAFQKQNVHLTAVSIRAN